MKVRSQPASTKIFFVLLILIAASNAQLLDVKDSSFQNLGFEDDPFLGDSVITRIPFDLSAMELGKWYNYIVERNCSAAAEGDQYARIVSIEIFQCIDFNEFHFDQFRLTADVQSRGTSNSILVVAVTFPVVVLNSFDCYSFGPGQPCSIVDMSFKTSKPNEWEKYDHVFDLNYISDFYHLFPNIIGFCVEMAYIPDDLLQDDFLIDNIGLVGTKSICPNPPPKHHPHHKQASTKHSPF
jgi:hypothetical protein